MTTYQLYIHLGKKARIRVGKLGVFVFPKGYYVYTGSAKKNGRARLKRHFSPTKKLRWHIDYFLHHENAIILLAKISRQKECQLNKLTPGHIIVPGFGSSDCRKGCGSHLKYLGEIIR